MEDCFPENISSMPAHLFRAQYSFDDQDLNHSPGRVQLQEHLLSIYEQRRPVWCLHLYLRLEAVSRMERKSDQFSLFNSSLIFIIFSASTTAFRFIAVLALSGTTSMRMQQWLGSSQKHVARKDLTSVEFLNWHFNA